jgi:hypothetical protein
VSNQSYLTGLRTRRDAISAELAALNASVVGGKPNSDGTGVNVDHVGYKDALYRELKELNGLIKDAEADVSADAGNVGIVESTEYV